MFFILKMLSHLVSLARLKTICKLAFSPTEQTVWGHHPLTHKLRHFGQCEAQSELKPGRDGEIEGNAGRRRGVKGSVGEAGQPLLSSPQPSPGSPT